MYNGYMHNIKYFTGVILTCPECKKDYKDLKNKKQLCKTGKCLKCQ